MTSEKDLADGVVAGMTQQISSSVNSAGVVTEREYVQPEPKVTITNTKYPTHISTRIEVGLTLPIEMAGGKTAYMKASATVELAGTKKVANEYIFRHAMKDLRTAFEWLEKDAHEINTHLRRQFAKSESGEAPNF